MRLCNTQITPPSPMPMKRTEVFVTAALETLKALLPQPNRPSVKTCTRAMQTTIAVVKIPVKTRVINGAVVSSRMVLSSRGLWLRVLAAGYGCEPLL